VRAVIQDGPGTLRLGALPDPAPGPGEIVVRMLATGICGSDLHVYRSGAYGPGVVLGHELAGEVWALGADVDGIAVGDRGAVHGGRSCGVCALCTDGLAYYCEESRGLGTAGAVGGLADFVVIPAGNFLPVGPGADPAAISFAEPLANALRLLDRPEVGDAPTALIIGAGPIGLVSLIAAQRRGVERIAVIEGRRRRRDAARALGAECVLDPGDDVAGAVRAMFGAGPPIVIEAVGAPATVLQAMTLTRPGGSVFLMGVCAEPIPMNPFRWMRKELTIRTSIGTGRAEHAAATALIAGGVVDAAPLITARVALADAPDAFAALAAGADEIKVVVEHER